MRVSSVLFWPFKILWALLSILLNLTGRLVAAVVGLVLLIAGIILTLLIIPAPIGIPFIVLGFLLMLRSIF